MLRDRFGGEMAADLASFSSSLEIDLRMAAEDIRGSIAHARMLGAVGMVGEAESEEIVAGLERIEAELASGDWVPSPEAEDIHMAVESRLIELVGEVGGKLHTARSRNDQVETAVRLWLRDRGQRLGDAVLDLVETLADRVESDGRTLLPGYTHLQRGQPILLGHQLLAHAWALLRDHERLVGALGRIDQCPLGAGAMAGTPWPIDREMTARELGFSGVVENAMDAVASRDHHQEIAAVATICMTHLSRMAEELVLWSTSEHGLLKLGLDYTTGSSIMPQKRNPDGAELIRGRAAKAHGQLAIVMGLTRSLPMAYNRDLQEGREPLFSLVEGTIASLGVMAGMWRSASVRSDRFEAELLGDFSLATELADELARGGVPFREAHGIVGRLVHWCEANEKRLDEVPVDVRRSLHPDLAGDLTALLDPRQAAERRTSRGGTAGSEIDRQLDLIRARLA